MISKQLLNHIQAETVPKSPILCSFFLEPTPALVRQLLDETVHYGVGLHAKPHPQRVTAALE